MRDEFHDQLIALLPRLRAQALALTRNRAEADDLVQDAVANALRARDSFTPGTHFQAWAHRILRNRFISLVRQRRETTDAGDLPSDALSTAPVQEDRLALKALHHAIGRLPLEQREALLLVVVQGLSYEEVAEAAGCAVGTVKSRVFRARRTLRAWLLGEWSDAGEDEAAGRGRIERRVGHDEHRRALP